MTKVAVVGGGIAGLTAAWELARAGCEVKIYEAGQRLGGVVAPLTLAGIELDAGAESFATRSSAVGDLIREVGLTERIVSPNPAGAWLQLPDLAAPLPATGVLGIPGDPQAKDVAVILGAEAAARAAEDLTAPMTWTAEPHDQPQPSLGEVVRDRMGQAVLDKLVAPITSGVHSAVPDDLALSAAHPELYARMLEQGSLARAVATLKAAAPAGSAVQSLHGGMNTLITGLQAELHRLGATIQYGTEVGDLNELQTEHIVLAVDEHQAAALAGRWLQVPTPRPGEAPTGVALVTALIHSPALDAFPRGTGMLVAPTVAHIGAKAMTHITAKWQWVRQQVTEQLGAGHHLIRLSYGRVTDDPDAATLGFASTDQQLLEAAVRDIPALTAVAVTPEQILKSAVVRWQRALPAVSAAHRSRAAQFRQALAQAPGAGTPKLWAVGAWAAGTGLAQVVPDARQTARDLLAYR